MRFPPPPLSSLLSFPRISHGIMAKCTALLYFKYYFKMKTAIDEIINGIYEVVYTHKYFVTTVHVGRPPFPLPNKKLYIIFPPLKPSFPAACFRHRNAFFMYYIISSMGCVIMVAFKPPILVRYLDERFVPSPPNPLVFPPHLYLSALRHFRIICIICYFFTFDFLRFFLPGRGSSSSSSSS